MTYHCGIGQGMAALGLAPRAPHFACDGCVAIHVIIDDFPPRWFRAGKAPPGWRKVPLAAPGLANHYCGSCSIARGLREPRRAGRAR